MPCGYRLSVIGRKVEIDGQQRAYEKNLNSWERVVE